MDDTWIDRFVDAIHNPPKDILDALQAEENERVLKEIEEDESLDFKWAEMKREQK